MNYIQISREQCTFDAAHTHTDTHTTDNVQRCAMCVWKCCVK